MPLPSATWWCRGRKCNRSAASPTRAASADGQTNALRAIDTKNDEGGVTYAGTCAGCHEGPRALPYGGIDLMLTSAISGPSADNLVNIVLYGLPAAEAARAPIMPGFAGAMNDAQVAALVRYLRARFSDKGPWTDILKSVHDARSRAAYPGGESSAGRRAHAVGHSAAGRQMKLNVNGSQHDVGVDPRTPLLYVLREDLKLNAAKFGCGLGQCGACTVLVDGEPVFSCVTPIALLAGKEVTTLEGLGTRRSPGPDPARLHRGAGGAMRLLYSGHHDAGACAVAEKSARQRGGHPRFPRAASVPLRHAYADPARHPSRPGGDAVGECGRQRMRAATVISRRAVLAGSGALVLSFASVDKVLAQNDASPPPAAPTVNPPPLPGSLKQAPYLNFWIRIDANGATTVFTGKAELGQGIKTALMQIAAEQLDVDFDGITLITADTMLTPNEGYTAGSHSMQDSGTAIMNAAAQVRQLLIAEAATRAGVPAAQLKTQNAAVIAPDGRRFGYGELVSAQRLHVAAAATSPLKDPSQFKVMNRRIPRVDIPAKVTGGAAFVQDLRPDGMVHARVVRPPSYGAQLAGVDDGAVRKMPGVLQVVRDGSFLARDRAARISSHRGDARTCGRRALERNGDAAGCQRIGRVPHRLAGAGHYRARSVAVRRKRRQNTVGVLFAALSVPRLDRSVLRGGAVRQRHAYGLDAHPRRLSGP